MYPGVWRHGDWIEITSRGTAIIYGRSDSTINRGGVRMGTSEIYRAVLALDEVVDALVVDVPRPGTDGWMPLFVVLREGARWTRSSWRRDPPADPRGLLAAARPGRGPGDRGGPADAVGEDPRGPVKRILTGCRAEQAASRESLANPAALDYFVAMGGASGVRRGGEKEGAGGLLRRSVISWTRYACQEDHPSMEEPIDKQIAVLAERQRGYVVWRQLIRVGVGREAISRRVKSGRLIVVYRGVYAVGHVPRLPQDRAYGALLACGPKAVLSHGTAATVYGIYRRWDLPFEVTAPGLRRRNGIRILRTERR